MCAHSETAQAEQIRAAVRVRIEPLPQPAGGRPDQESAELAAGGRHDVRPETVERGPNGALEGFQGDIAREAVAHDDVRRLVQKLARLDVPDEPQGAREQERVRLSDEPVALIRLLAD